MVEGRDEFITRVEEEHAIAREEGGPELKRRSVPLAVRNFAHGNDTFAGLTEPHCVMSIQVITLPIAKSQTRNEHDKDTP